MVCDRAGDMPEGRRRLGLYYRDMRHLSIFDLKVNGQRPRLLASSSEQNYVCDMQLANPTIKTMSSSRISCPRPNGPWTGWSTTATARGTATCCLPPAGLVYLVWS